MFMQLRSSRIPNEHARGPVMSFVRFKVQAAEAVTQNGRLAGSLRILIGGGGSN